jgi:hypothetical protein
VERFEADSDFEAMTIYFRLELLSAHRADRNAMARTTIQPTMTKDVTAPAVIFAFSLKVVG